MPVLYDLIEHYKVLREKTAEEIYLIDSGKLAIIRGGHDCSKRWAAELRDQLVKMDALLAASSQIALDESTDQ